MLSLCFALIPQELVLSPRELVFVHEELLIPHEKYCHLNIFFAEQPLDYETYTVSLDLSYYHHCDSGFHQNLF